MNEERKSKTEKLRGSLETYDTLLRAGHGDLSSVFRVSVLEKHPEEVLKLSGEAARGDPVANMLLLGYSIFRNYEKLR